MDLLITILPVVTKDLSISPRLTPYDFLSRCKFGTLTTRQPMVQFDELMFPRFPLQKKEHKSYFGKNRTHDFRTSRCAGYLLDHSGDECRQGESCRNVSLATSAVTDWSSYYTRLAINRVKLPILFVASWTENNEYFPRPRLRLRNWFRERGSTVPSGVSLLIFFSNTRLNLVVTHGLLSTSFRFDRLKTND